MGNKQLPIPYASAPGGSAGSGTVTSVALTGDGTVLNSVVTGSPVTTSGALAPTLKTQTANTVLAGPTSGGAATPSFRVISSGDLPPLGYAGVYPILPNLVTRKIMTVSASGDTDLYTVPTGKRAFATLNTWNATGGTIAHFSQVKIGGTYYRTGAVIAGATGTGGTPFYGIVLEAGQIFSLNAAAINLYIVGTVFEFDTTANLKSYVLTSFASGDNAFAAVPVGKTFSGQFGQPWSTNANNATLQVCNNTGGAITYSWNLVASAGSASTANRVVTTASIADKTLSTSAINYTLSAGDFISINTTSTAAQIAFVTGVEY